MAEEYDKVTQASMNNLYVEAKRLDRGQNEIIAPQATPAGLQEDVGTHASTHASDAESHASDATAHVSDAESRASDCSDDESSRIDW